MSYSLTPHEIRDQITTASRMSNFALAELDKRDKEIKGLEEKHKVRDILSFYNKKKHCKFIEKCRHVKGKVCLTASIGKLQKELASFSDKIIEDLLVFDEDENATLPSEAAAPVPPVSPAAPVVM